MNAPVTGAGRIVVPEIWLLVAVTRIFPGLITCCTGLHIRSGKVENIAPVFSSFPARSAGFVRKRQRPRFFPEAIVPGIWSQKTVEPAWENSGKKPQLF
jgi:hypothetical protein